MTAGAPSTSAEVPLAPSRASRRWAVVESLLERAGDRLNPILVKEARQALKSRMFVITFGLLLACAWGGTIVGLALIGPEVSLGSYGPNMFAVYFIILAFALLVVVPFGAFRSLAVEQEERTYELLSITALGPAQIVRGKLGSAFVQMLIHLSAISPCLAFTYLLRGIDFPSILYMIASLVLASLGLSAIGLLLGTLTEQKQLQVVLAVMAIIGLLIAFWTAVGFAMMFVFQGALVFSDPYFWGVTAAVLTIYLSYFALVYRAAVARITFASENRSTPLRCVMVVQHMTFAAWLAVWAIVEETAVAEPGFWLFCLCIFAVHWYVMGGLMLGESPELSLRVRRRLPQSFLGRCFFTWFNPGPGTGYVFALSGMLAALIMAAFALGAVSIYLPGGRFGRLTGDGIVCALGFGLLCLSYMAIYLGVGLLVIRLLRRWARIDVLAAALLQVVLVIVGCGLPPVVQALSLQWRSQGYTLVQLTNFFWTLDLFFNRRLPPEAPELLLLVPGVALVVFALNLRGIVREVQYVRIAKPLRVAEEDAALVPPPPPPPRPGPWD
jgi:hypothetical protein